MAPQAEPLLYEVYLHAEHEDVDGDAAAMGPVRVCTHSQITLRSKTMFSHLHVASTGWERVGTHGPHPLFCYVLSPTSIPLRL